MEQSFIYNWIYHFTESWKNHDVEAILNLFDDIQEYYEGPFSDPVSSRDEIAKLWVETEFQNIKTLNVEPIALENGICAMHWFLDYEDSRDNNEYVMDGTYEVHFDSQGHCIFFKQWWVVAY